MFAVLLVGIVLLFLNRERGKRWRQREKLTSTPTTDNPTYAMPDQPTYNEIDPAAVGTDVGVSYSALTADRARYDARANDGGASRAYAAPTPIYQQPGGETNA